MNTIQRAGLLKAAGQLAGMRELEQRQVRELPSHRGRVERAARQKCPVAAQQRRGVALAQPDCGPQLSKPLRLQRRDDHSSEGGVGGRQRPRRVDHPAARRAADHRVANEESGLRLLAMDAEVQPVAERHADVARIGVLHDAALCVHHPHRANEGQVAQLLAQQRARCVLVERSRCSGLGQTAGGDLQPQVDRLQRAHGLLLDCVGQGRVALLALRQVLRAQQQQ